MAPIELCHFKLKLIVESPFLKHDSTIGEKERDNAEGTQITIEERLAVARGLRANKATPQLKTTNKLFSDFRNVRGRWSLRRLILKVVLLPKLEKLPSIA